MQIFKNKIIPLTIALILILYAILSKNIIIDTPTPVEPDPNNTVPKVVLKDNIFFNNYETAKNIANKYNKKLLLIFGADWCPHCKDLKKDIVNIVSGKELIVSIIDIDQQPNKILVNEYKVMGIPTSIIFDQNIEEARKTGYKRRDYINWLENNESHGDKTWSVIELQ